jgi:8-oxo-dGTP pyrophosphatase MutT (NUDIX family)
MYKIPRSVLVVIHTPALEVLLLERAPWRGYWQSVTGSVAREAEPLGEAAAREVREETGVTVEVGAKLGEVSYAYRRDGRRIRKIVHFYLCSFVSGSTDDHDHEVDDARWIPLERALTALTYEGERRLIARAMSRLAAQRR